MNQARLQSGRQLNAPGILQSLRDFHIIVATYPHGLPAYARNVIKRAAFRNLWLYLVHGRTTDWPTLARSLGYAALQRGGVFHLWGHSWELEEHGLWGVLDRLLRLAGRLVAREHRVANADVAVAKRAG